MRERLRTRPLRMLSPLGAAVVALLLAWPIATPAQAADARLEEARARSAAIEQRLSEVLSRLDAAQAATADVEARVEDLQSRVSAFQRAAQTADSLVEARVRDAYKRGELPAAFAMFTGDPDGEAAQRARLLSVMAVRHNAESEAARSARVRAAAAAAELSQAVEQLQAREAELDAARADVAAALEQAESHEASVERTIAAEIAERQQAARERAARQAAARSAAAPAAAPAATATDSGAADSADDSAATGGGGGGGAAPVSGGIACPIGSPRSYSDTYGAPRSGGRSHMGTDILSPMGTPIYAYESGTITRMDGNSLGGISLYLSGSSGTVYYYTHLSGYADSASVGKSVSAGEHIAYNGDSGNAAGIPHLHFEVMPGGGSNVNPYPYVLRACG